MSAVRLDGKAVAAELTAAVGLRAAALPRRPGLAVVLVGDDPASAVYVRNKSRTAEQLGFHHVQIDLPAATAQDELLAVVDQLSADPQIDGILVQFPLPKHLDKEAVLDRLDPAKDVDGLHVVNAGLLTMRRPCLVPCTPAGVMELLRRTGPLAGAEAVIVGRSNLVGKPLVQLLEQADCTVTLAHSRTRDLATVVGRAEVVVAAVGVPQLVKGAWIREGARVIDVGINRGADGKLVGDVEYAPAAERASFITPVPGGVGPMTIAMLYAEHAHGGRAAAGPLTLRFDPAAAALPGAPVELRSGVVTELSVAHAEPGRVAAAVGPRAVAGEWLSRRRPTWADVLLRRTLLDAARSAFPDRDASGLREAIARTGFDPTIFVGAAPCRARRLVDAELHAPRGGVRVTTDAGLDPSGIEAQAAFLRDLAVRRDVAVLWLRAARRVGERR